MGLPRETFANFFNVTVFVAAILLTLLQNEFVFAEIIGQLKANTLSDAVTNKSEDDGGGSSAPFKHFESAVAVNDIAKQPFQQRKEINKGKNDQNRIQAFIFPFGVNTDADWPEMSKDKKERQVGSDFSNKPSTSHENSKNKIKATDYFYILPASRSRSRSMTYSSSENSILEIARESDRKGTKYIVKQSLNSKSLPAVSFEVNSKNAMFIFEVDEQEKTRYFISIVVERMSCRTDDDDRNETSTPKLLIQGEENELSICKKFDNSANNYQSVDYLTSGDKSVSIIASGNWSNTTVATLVASVYTEAVACHYCPVDHFCCGRKDTACAATAGKYYKNRNDATTSFNGAQQEEQLHRCIPKQDASGRSLICNGHPNCGFHCNVDEHKASCPKEEDNGEENCSGYYCREYQEQDRFLITLLLLIMFCVFVPLIIFLFICSRKELRREIRRRGRCPAPLEIIFCPFSISADDPNSISTSATPTSTARQRQSEIAQQQSRARGNAQRHLRAAAQVGSRREALPGLENPGFFGDLPPSYSECCHDKVTFPNPPGVHQTECTEGTIVSLGGTQTVCRADFDVTEVAADTKTPETSQYFRH